MIVIPGFAYPVQGPGAASNSRICLPGNNKQLHKQRPYLLNREGVCRSVSTFRKINVIIFPSLVWPLLALTMLLAVFLSALYPGASLVTLYYGSPLKGITVAIDPGHGGIDSGTHFESRILEKDIVLEIGLELRRLLEQAGARVMITREKDEDLSRHCPDETMALHRRDVHGRTRLINASQADFSLSLHINSIYDPSVRGPIAFYAGGNPENKRLADTIQKNVNPLFGAEAKPGQLMHQQPQESNAYYILNETTMPSVLLEIAFMTNPDDRELLINRSFKQGIARGIFMGIVEYVYSKQVPEKPGGDNAE